MKILLTGRDGQVGWELQRTLSVLGQVTAVARTDCDLADIDAIHRLVRETTPDLIVHPAAYTAVDRAQSEPDLAFAINAAAPAALARAAQPLGAALILFSTDYVFDGTKDQPYVETDPTHPLSVYGASKLAGERALAEAGVPHLILRTSWVYAARGGNFLRTMLKLARERERLRIVADQFGAPTWARTIAEATAAIVARAGRDRASVARSLADRGGIYHMTCAGRTSWYDYAQRIFALVDDPQRRLTAVDPITAAEYPTPATRPRNSVLSTAKLARDWGIQMPAWDHALALCVQELQA